MPDDPTPPAGNPSTTLGGGDPPAPDLPAVPIDVLPEEIRSDGALAPHIKEGKLDYAGLAKSYVHAQKLVGADKVVLPKPDAPREEWDAFFKRLGRPDEPTGYELAAPEGVEYKADEATDKWFRETAHRLGLSRTQANELFAEYVKFADAELRQAAQATEQQRAEALSTLQREYGTALQEKVAVAQKAVEFFGGDDLKTFLDESGLGDHPALVKAFVKIGEAMSEDTLGPAVHPARFGYTPEAAQRRIAELRADEAWADPMNPRHAEVMKEINDLLQHAYPTQA